MKIRINGNRLRLRLAKTEVSHLVANREVSDHCQIGVNTLTYKILSGDYPTLDAAFSDQIITVFVPNALTEKWDENDRVGFDGHDANGLYILVEKDFQCLSPREEDESDLYPNPVA